jgi:hypothetical protein
MNATPAQRAARIVEAMDRSELCGMNDVHAAIEQAIVEAVAEALEEAGKGFECPKCHGYGNDCSLCHDTNVVSEQQAQSYFDNQKG